MIIIIIIIIIKKDFLKHKTVKTNYKIRCFGVVMTPLSRNDKNKIMQITYRVKGHKQRSSAIAKHYKNMHGTMPQGLLKRFQVLKKCKNKFHCLVYEMLFIRALKPNLNVQSDSIPAKVFLESSHSLRLIFRAKIALKAVRNLHDLIFIVP